MERLAYYTNLSFTNTDGALEEKPIVGHKLIENTSKHDYLCYNLETDQVISVINDNGNFREDCRIKASAFHLIFPYNAVSDEIFYRIEHIASK